MWEQIDVQAVADSLKGLLYRSMPTPGQRREHKAVFDLLQVFEGSGWNPDAFKAALEEVGGFTVFSSGKAVQFRRNDRLVEGIEELLNRYMELTGQVTEIPGMYSIEEAARYLGVSERAVKYHYHESKRLEGCVIRGVFFRREVLDRFKDDPPKRGNPSKESRRRKK